MHLKLKLREWMHLLGISKAMFDNWPMWENGVHYG